MVKAGRVVGDAISRQCVKTDPICEIAARPASRRIQGGRLASRIHDKSGRHPDLWNVRRSELEVRYRGLAKNTAQVMVLIGLANLYALRRRLVTA
jgi:IS5 family transposase